MSTTWQFVLLGFGLAPAYILIGQSMVVVFRGSNVVNFASGGFAAIGAAVYYEVHQSGSSIAVALILGLLTGAIGGAVTYQFVIRRLGDAAQMVRVVATLGIQIVIVQALTLHYSNEVFFPPQLFATGETTIFGASIATYSLILLAFAVALTAGLWAVYRFTMFGLSTSAVAENRRAAAALGRSPQTIGLANWALGGTLAALAGILVTPELGLSVASLSLLIVPALAVSLLGSFRSFWLVLLSGLILGIGESELTNLVGDKEWGFGWPASFPFLIIVAVLLFRGTSLPERGFVAARLPAIGLGRVSPVLAVAGVAAAALLIGVLSEFGAASMGVSLGAGLILLSLILVTGYAGQLSLAQVGIAGCGAFIAARFAEGFDLSFWLAALAGVVLIIPVGIAVGATALRSRGVNLAIITLALGLVIDQVLLSNENYTGGISGINVPAPTLFGLSLDNTLYPRRYAWLCLAIFTLAAFVVSNLRRGRVGRHLIAVRGNERAAVSLGINLTLAKLYAFVVAAALAALGGIMLAFQANNVQLSGAFTSSMSISYLSFAVIGGLGYVSGVSMSATLVPAGIGAWVAGEIFGSGDVAAWIALLSGFLTIFLLLKDPDGFASLFSKRSPMARAWRAAESKLRQRRRRGSSTTASPSEAAAPAGASRPVTVRPGTLEVKDLRVQFGGVVALDEVGLTVRPGEIVGLIGPNGAGKTTLVDATTGMVPRYTGSVTLNGESLDGLSPTKRSRSGLGRSFQSLELFEDLSVVDNLRVASDPPSTHHYVTDLVRPTTPPLPDAVMAAIKEFDLADELDRKPSELSFGQRRLVSIARAVAYQPSVLLLDEPASGLDDHESNELARLLRRLADEWQFGILLIEHDMNVVLTVSDRVVVIDFGKKIADGTPDEIRSHPAVVAAYLGAPEPAAV